MAAIPNNDSKWLPFLPTGLRRLPLLFLLWTMPVVWAAEKPESANLPPPAQKQIDFVHSTKNKMINSGLLANYRTDSDVVEFMPCLTVGSLES